MLASAEQGLLDHDADEEREHDRHQHQGGAEVLRTLLLAIDHRDGTRRHGSGCRPPQRTCGGVSNVWWGAGLGTVHSSPCAFSQTSVVAGVPWPRTHFITQYTKSNCESPKPKAPIDDRVLKSANCSA